ncbi:MAG: hypothetical protein ABI134_29840 [Byssovorax sp.]
MASWSSFLFSYARRSPTIGLAFTLALGGAALAAPGGCTLNTAGLAAGGSSSSASTSTLTTTSTSTSTGTGSCATDDDCDAAPVGGCMKRICSSSMCKDEVDLSNKPASDNNPCTSEACTAAGAPEHPAILAGMKCEGKLGVCTSSGDCVECLNNGDCSTGTTPSCNTTTNTCGSCSDKVKNGTETGMDCGGTCPACLGDPCTTGGTCLSGKCADKVCCTSDCTGTCQACNVPGSLGLCINAPAEKPDPACGLKVCDGAGACQTPAGGLCSENSGCASGICIASTCRAPTNGACTEDAVCESGLCTGSVCTACSTNNQCKSNACVAKTCKAPGGAICSASSECAGGNCQSSLFCMLENNSACTTSADCKSGVCTGGTCLPCMNDNDCSGGAKCSGAFGPNTCSLSVGAYCYIDAYCPSGTTCQGTPGKCK